MIRKKKSSQDIMLSSTRCLPCACFMKYLLATCFVALVLKGIVELKKINAYFSTSKEKYANMAGFNTTMPVIKFKRKCRLKKQLRSVQTSIVNYFFRKIFEN
ncbi:hypothetical protein Tsp_13457, partial [Trichinella spiralis]|uniref:hypothetical protein n=1 Tax=Trichinella spiralis TaxID=6334 RepID=UPI0001EFEB7D